MKNRVWNFVTSPQLIVALNVAGLALQMIHQIEQFRKGARKVKIGFYNDKDE